MNALMQLPLLNVSRSPAPDRARACSFPQRRQGDASGVRVLRTCRSAFTLAEVLAALAFMAIVIPVAVEGLRIASRAGQVGQHKAVAARIADRVLNEWIISDQGVAGLSRGLMTEGAHEYRWTLESGPWPEGGMRLVTVEVQYTVQGQEHEVRISTLADPSEL
jgi:hypothetical protein